ncbi:hypothetical protein PHYPO_G00236460 [Pangasianodon hypophthalmus]|uniref:Uncharacterized protein n=2 Tax=Pangasianodon hypophthalmus TaxID=310915 RepID=A0A5N5NKE1_PANHP|nr:hypothetical protein PHYPO_G00236460 [Pangasianodon hypophthalmus]
MEQPLMPRESGRYVAERSRDVFVDEEGVKKVAEMLYTLRDSEVFTASGWKMMNPLAPSPDTDEAINWVFVTDTMNFSFWPDREDQQCEVNHRGTTYRGYMSLCAAVTRAMDEGVPITDPAYFSQMSEDDLAHVLRSDNDTPMPMLKERHQALTEAGRVLMQHGGSFRSFISHGQNDAEKWCGTSWITYPPTGTRLRTRARGFPSIRGLRSLWQISGGSWRPEALVYLGALRYSDALMEALKKGELLSSGERREVEIRGCSIWCVEKIKNDLWQLVQERDGKSCGINSALIDFYLDCCRQFAVTYSGYTRLHETHHSRKLSSSSSMASALISVPTTASRFALLQVDSDSDTDSDTGKAKSSRESGKSSRSGKSTGAKSNQNTDKKKDKKKRKKEQQQSETNELRNLAFKKLPQKSSAPPSTLTLQGLANELLNSTDRTSAPQESWQEWKQRDERLTSELYEADLEKALMLSKLEFEQQKKDAVSAESASPKAKAGGKKEKKKNQQGKDKRITVSLKDFQQEGNMGENPPSKRPEREEPKPANTAVHEKKFFNQLEDDVNRIVQRDKRREQYSCSAGQEVNTSSEQEQDVRTEQLKFELEKKDQEIVKLKKTISQWEERYKEVKARNAQLLKMLQQGEMKDKAEILQQVEELLNIKEELTKQVTLLHASLEQERSKVKGLQSEQPKHQTTRKGKKGPEGDL